MTRIHILMLATVLFVRTSNAVAQCCGDCNGDGRVSIDELVHAVTLALGSCPSTTGPQISLSDVQLSTFAASLVADVTQVQITVTMATDWAGNDGSERAFVSISQPHTWPSRVELVKNGDFLRWVVTESSGREQDLSVRIDQWQPGNHTITVGVGSGSAAITADNSQTVQTAVGDVVLTAGSTFFLGPEPGTNYMSGEGTTFRNVVFNSGLAD